MNISMMVKNLNVYLLKQQKDTYMNMMCECLDGNIFNYIDLNTGEIKDNQCLFLIDIKTNDILSFYIDNENLNNEAKQYAKLISVTTSYDRTITRNNNPLLMVRTNTKQVLLTIKLYSSEIVLEGDLLNIYRKDNYVIIGTSYHTLTTSF